MENKKQSSELELKKIIELKDDIYLLTKKYRDFISVPQFCGNLIEAGISVWLVCGGDKADVIALVKQASRQANEGHQDFLKKIENGELEDFDENKEE